MGSNRTVDPASGSLCVSACRPSGAAHLGEARAAHVVVELAEDPFAADDAGVEADLARPAAAPRVVQASLRHHADLETQAAHTQTL